MGEALKSSDLCVSLTKVLQTFPAQSVLKLWCIAVFNTGSVSQAAGSAYAEFNKTKVMAAV